MTREWQRKFIRDLLGSIQKELFDKLSEAPTEWDGIELRWWIAYAACEACPDRRPRRKRFKDFKNEALVKNL